MAARHASRAKACPAAASASCACALTPVRTRIAAGASRRVITGMPWPNLRAEISLGSITAHHAMRGEDCADLADRALHYAGPAGWIAMKQRQYGVSSLSYSAFPLVSGESPSLSMAHPVTPSMQPSTHQPSSTLRLGTPLSAAFIPLVPDVSRGGCGVFSQISAPDTSLRARAMS